MEIEVRENIVTDGLVLHLDSWNSSSYSGSGSTWTDLSGNGNNAELRYSYSYSDKSITFADSGYANITDTSDFDFSGDFSLESWFYLTGTPNATYPSPIFASWESGSTSNDKIILFINSSLQIALQVNTGTNTLIYPSTISLNQWYHIVVSRVNGIINIYLNGQKGTSLNYSTEITPILDMRIGAYQIITDPDPMSHTFEGKIPVARIYKDKGLTEKEVQQNHINQKGRFFGQGSFSVETRENIVTNGLVNYLNVTNKNSYPGSGTTWYDLSANNRNGTISGSYSDGSLFFNPGYVNFSQYNFGNEFTFIAFINPTTASTISSLFSNSAAGQYTNGIRIFINFELSNSRTLHIELGNGSSSQLITSASNTVTYGVWQQVAFTLNKTTAKGAIYHNGIKVKEDNLNFTNFNSNAAFNFGVTGGAYAYVGRLSNFITYNRALTSAEIQKNYIQGYSADSLSLF